MVDSYYQTTSSSCYENNRCLNIPLSFTRVENIVQSLLAARLVHARGSEWGVWRWLHKRMRTRGWSDEDVDLGRDL